MRTRPFLRTTEFLWQEGHTVHVDEEDAERETLKYLHADYDDFVEKEMAVPVIKGIKTDKEKFAGALRSYAIEAMMQDGRALQVGTSHNLGQNFAKAFDINYTDQNNQVQHAWTTSWGVSTRLIGALIMAHYQCADETSAHAPACGPGVLYLIVLIGVIDVECLGEILAQVVRCAHLQGAAILHHGFDGIGAQCAGKLLFVGLDALDHWHGHFFFHEIVVIRVQVF